MLEEDGEVDLEDLESRLYSQVYHSTNPDADLVLNPINLQQNSAPIRQKYHRYFQVRSDPRNSTPKIASSSPKIMYSLDNYSQIPKTMNTSNNLNTSQPHMTLGNIYNTTTAKQNKRKLKRKQRELLKKLNNQIVNQTINNSEIATSSSNVNTESEIICLSDESDSDCVEIIEENDNQDKKPVILPKIEPETKPKKTEIDELNDPCDDIILIENEPEIINVDDESVHGTPTKNAPQTSPKDKDISTSEHLMPDTRQNKATQRNEESPASPINDFLDNPEMELSQTKFNFSLHGTEYQGDFLKPTTTNRGDTCETASSSSTTELQTVTPIVFNEVEFPKDDIFSEANLESFGNFITPNRSRTGRKSANSTAEKELVKRNVYESDSSSESDFDEEGTNVSYISKNLPELSVVDTAEDVNSQVPISNSTRIVENNSDAIANESLANDNLQSDCKKRRTNNSDNFDNKKIKLGDEVVEIIESTSDETVKNSDKNKLIESIQDETVSNNSVLVDDNNLTEKSIPNIFQCDIIPSTNQNHFADEFVKNKENTNSTISASNVLDDFIIVDEAFVDDDVDESRNELFFINTIGNEESVDLVEKDSKDERKASSRKSIDSVGNDSKLKDNQKSNKSLNEVLLELEKFDVKKIQSGMSDDPKLWEIIHLDKINFKMNVYDPKCKRCKQKGHKAELCPSVNQCHLCGFDGHITAKCPLKLCTQCGRKGNYLTVYCRKCNKYRNRICDICKLNGHSIKNCPDLWRRYYLTTKDGPPVQSKITTISKDKIWCSGCGKFGHLVHSCRHYNSLYPPTSPFIFSYADINSEQYKNYMLEVNAYHGSDIDEFNESTQNQINFNDNLPNFINLDSNKSTKRVHRLQLKNSIDNHFERGLAVVQSKHLRDMSMWNTRKNLFYNQDVKDIKEYLGKELDLVKNMKSVEVTKNLKYKMNKKRGASRFMNYRVLNMLLFGVHKIDTGKHLNALQEFQNLHVENKLARRRRRTLFFNYMYVFGSQKHKRVDYKQIINKL